MAPSTQHIRDALHTSLVCAGLVPVGAGESAPGLPQPHEARFWLFLFDGQVAASAFDPVGLAWSLVGAGNMVHKRAAESQGEAQLQRGGGWNGLSPEGAFWLFLTIPGEKLFEIRGGICNPAR